MDWTQLSGGAAINDALLSGSIDIAGAGVGPLLTIWDRTHGRQNIKAVASLGNFPYYLVSNNPQVKTIADISDKDRIAVPAVGVSVQSRFLQYAAAKQWGDKAFNRLDKYTLALPHPDATAALIAGGTELSGHFSNPPFQDQALKNPNVHVVLDSYDLLGPNSPTVLFASEKFRNDWAALPFSRTGTRSRVENLMSDSRFISRLLQVGCRSKCSHDLPVLTAIWAYTRVSMVGWELSY